MLPSMKSAHHAGGRSKSAIAKDMGITTQTLACYMNGKHPVPPYRYAAMTRAFGVQSVDWEAYTREYDEAQGAPPPAPKQKAGERPPASHPSAVAGSWGAPVAPKAPAAPKAAPAPAPAPSEATPKPKGGFLSRILSDDGTDMLGGFA